MRRAFIVGGVILSLLAVSAASAQSTSRLDTVKRRGRVICGVNNTLPGFGFLESNGSYSGFDTDLCRAVAAGVLGDASKVDFVPLTAAARFTAIQSGEVDVVFRNTTVTSTRDASTGSGIDFLPITFYDGQAVMVKNSSPAKRIIDLEGATICAIQGTTTEQNITDYMKLKKKTFKLLTFADAEKVMAGLVQGRCDATTSDSSQLAAVRAAQPDPKQYRIISELISKEPLAGFVGQNDSRWRDAVTWIVNALIYAEEVGARKANVESLKTSTDPVVRRFVGAEGDTGKNLGLEPDFAVDVVKAVGNYAELYNKYFGTNTKFAIPRGLNRPFSSGGLLYSPPFR
jgi:general L-amino acid transport system substrate-binding protein